MNQSINLAEDYSLLTGPGAVHRATQMTAYRNECDTPFILYSNVHRV